MLISQLCAPEPASKPDDGASRIVPHISNHGRSSYAVQKQYTLQTQSSVCRTNQEYALRPPAVQGEAFYRPESMLSNPGLPAGQDSPLLMSSFKTSTPSDEEAESIWFSSPSFERASILPHIEGGVLAGPPGATAAAAAGGGERRFSDCTTWNGQETGSEENDTTEHSSNSNLSTSRHRLPSLPRDRDGSGSEGKRTTPMAKKNPLQKKRSTNDSEDDDDIHHAEYGNGKKAKLGEEMAPFVREFACPFYKRNRQRYWQQRSCRTSGWPSVHRVKEHLYRHHMHSVCGRCSRTFKNQEQLRAHVRQKVSCQVSPRYVAEDAGFDQEVEKKLRSRKKIEGQNECDKWAHMYRLLFPSFQDKPTPSPFVDYDPRDDPPPPYVAQPRDDPVLSPPDNASPLALVAAAAEQHIATSTAATAATAATAETAATTQNDSATTATAMTPPPLPPPSTTADGRSMSISAMASAASAASTVAVAAVTGTNAPTTTTGSEEDPAAFENSIRRIIAEEVRAVFSSLPSPTVSSSP